MSSTLIILAITVASFLLGFLRDLLIARQFGVSWEADLIFVALILPVFFESFFGLALRDAMIPYLQRIRDRCNAQYEQVGRWLYWRIGLFGLLLSVIGVLASPWLMHALAPGWSDEQVETGKLVFAVGTLLICVQAVLYCQGALLNLDRIFILPMTRTLMLNLGAILAIVILQPSGIALFTGMLLPQVLLIVIQHRRLGYLGQRSVAFEKPEGSPFAVTFAPVLLAAGAQQGCMLAERFFASLLAEGNITMLSFSYRIVTIPLTLYALSILAMIFPELTRSWNEGNADKYSALMRKALLGTLLFLVPAAVVLFSYSEPVVKVLLERGDRHPGGGLCPGSALDGAGPAVGACPAVAAARPHLPLRHPGQLLHHRGPGRCCLSAIRCPGTGLLLYHRSLPAGGVHGAGALSPLPGRPAPVAAAALVQRGQRGGPAEFPVAQAGRPAGADRQRQRGHAGLPGAVAGPGRT